MITSAFSVAIWGPFSDVVGSFFPLPSSSAALNCTLQHGFSEAVGSDNMAIQFHFPLLSCYEEGFVVACGLSDGAAGHLFVCDVVQVGDDEDSLICSISAQLFVSFSANLFLLKVQDPHA